MIPQRTSIKPCYICIDTASLINLVIEEKNKTILEANLILQRQKFQLNEAQRIAKLGSWEFNPTTCRYSWSDELFEMLGFNKNFGVPPLFSILKK